MTANPKGSTASETDARIARVRARTQDNPMTLARLAVLAEQEAERLRRALRDIRDPRAVGNYDPKTIIAIYRKWADLTLKEPAPAAAPTAPKEAE